MATKHIDHEDVVYFGAIEQARQAKREICSDELYEMVYEYPPITEKECRESWEQSNFTPEEYFW